ncbi:carbonic anhydrase [Rummeliibacillus pycnus]|uniref:carbonic anhydrase n=1 Tax=Rummeliibacillus pycnus TaxID=101070 RepID=UPI003D27B943
MYIDGNKKVLFLTGMGKELESTLYQMKSINPENIIILQEYGQLILQPFDDFMRDIILTVYHENIEEIFVIDSNKDQKNVSRLLNKIYENKELHGKIQTVDYLLKNCAPEYTEGSISEWLEGSNSLTNNLQKNINIIRNHPLLPSTIKVTELFIDLENGRLTDVDISKKVLL